MKSSPFINRDLISRHFIDCQARARHSGEFRAITIWEAHRPTAVTSHNHMQQQELSGVHLWVVQTLLRHLGSTQMTLLENHDVIMCMLNTSALQEGGRRLDLWGRAALMESMRQGRPETCPGPWFYTNSSTKLLGHPSISFNLSSYCFYPLHEMGLCFFLLSPQGSLAICCLFGQMSPQTGLASCSGSHDSLLSSRPPCYWVQACSAGRVCVSHSVFLLFATPWTIACRVPQSMEFSRQEYWSELSFPSPADLPDLGIKWVSCIAGRFFTLWATREATWEAKKLGDKVLG